jgi:hypothetical protein
MTCRHHMDRHQPHIGAFTGRFDAKEHEGAGRRALQDPTRNQDSSKLLQKTCRYSLRKRRRRISKIGYSRAQSLFYRLSRVKRWHQSTFDGLVR